MPEVNETSELIVVMCNSTNVPEGGYVERKMRENGIRIVRTKGLANLPIQGQSYSLVNYDEFGVISEQALTNVGKNGPLISPVEDDKIKAWNEAVEAKRHERKLRRLFNKQVANVNGVPIVKGRKK